MASRDPVVLLGVMSPYRQAIQQRASAEGREVLRGSLGDSALGAVSRVALAVAEVRGDEEGVYEQVRSAYKMLGRCAFVVLGRGLGAELTVRLLRLGVADVIELPAPAEDVAARAFQHTHGAECPPGFEEIVGGSPCMQTLRAEVQAAARVRSSVLILGETGTGKGLITRVMHESSPWRERPWVHVDCAALSPTLIESELFGHERGAFTGAAGLRRGRFEMAEDGTIFLDEIGDLELPLQAKLLRVIENREYERVGGSETLRMRARVVAATSHDLAPAVREGRFRRDLYYRLNVIQIRVPPLRQRSDDIPLLVRAGLQKLSARLDLPLPSASHAFYGRLMSHTWPGNVRELMNVLERCLVRQRGLTLDAHDLHGLLAEDSPAPSRAAEGQAEVNSLEGADLDPERITQVLVACGGNVTRAARRLGIPRGTLRYRIEQLGLESLIPKD